MPHTLAYLCGRLLLAAWTLFSAAFVLALLDCWFSSLRLMRHNRVREWWRG